MNYHPRGQYQWDTWFLNQAGTVHAYYLKRNRPGYAHLNEDSIGHAVSRNLLDWTELPDALLPGVAGELDDMTLFSGSALMHRGVFHLFYTMRCSRENGLVQRIGLAVSGDGQRFVKHPENPILRPEPPHYCTEEQPAARGIVDCRDLVAVPSPDGAGFYGFYAARQPSREMPAGAVIACVFSEDLVHWRHLPPAFSPGRYTIVEVPEVFCLDGRWYMLCLTNNEYGNRNPYDEPGLCMATIYAVADRVEGPYIEPEDNILIGSTHYNGLACHPVEMNGSLYVLYTQAERDPPSEWGRPTMGCLTTPKELRLVDGRLRAVYSPLIEQKISDRLFSSHALPPRREDIHLIYETTGEWHAESDGLHGQIETAWSQYLFDAKGAGLLYRATVTIKCGAAAGLVLHQREDGYSGWAILADVHEGTIGLFRLPGFQPLEQRQLPFTYHRAYGLTVISKGRFVEVYVDGILYIQSVIYAAQSGYMGLLVDRGAARFDDVRADALDLGAGEEYA